MTRDDIAGALGEVAGLAPSAATPQTVVAGSAWPEWVSTAWVNAQGQREYRWYVFVALSGGDRQATASEGDPLVESVAAALWEIGLWPELVEPWQWAVEPGAQAVPVLRFSVRE